MGLPVHDLVSVLETAYDFEEPEDSAYLAKVASAVDRYLDPHGRHTTCATWTFDATDAANVVVDHTSIVRGDPGFLKLMAEVQSSFDTAAVEHSYRGKHGITLALDMLSPVPHVRAVAAAKYAEVGLSDVVGFMASDPSRRGLIITWGAKDPSRPFQRGELRRWDRIAAHIAAGHRLRRSRFEEGEAVLTPTGRVEHAEGPATTRAARAALREAAVAVDRARGRMRRDDPDRSLDLWRGLVSGRWSIVDRFDSDGRRYLVARRNDPTMPDPRALSLRERQVVGFAALGHSNKLIAYELGLAETTVATNLARAMRKLGVRNRVELAALAWSMSSK